MLMLRTLQEKMTSRPIAAVWFPTGATKIELVAVLIESETFAFATETLESPSIVDKNYIGQALQNRSLSYTLTW